MVNKLPLEALKNHSKFKKLTKLQQKFLEFYITNSYDETAATKAVYNCSSEASARAMAVSILRSPKVRVCLELHIGSGDKEDFLRRVRELQRSKTIDKDRLTALRLEATIAEYTNKGIVPTSIQAPANVMKTIPHAARPEDYDLSFLNTEDKGDTNKPQGA